MSIRLNPLMSRMTTGLGFVASAAGLLTALSLTPACAAAAPADQALMLRPGNWSQNVGSFVRPAALTSTPQQWPVQGWYRVTRKLGHLQVQAVAAPAAGLPAFLRDVALQLSNPGSEVLADEAERYDTSYIRVPGVAISEGRLPLVKFSNEVLHPMLDHTYALQLGDAAFTLTVQNGLRNKSGVAYGGGAQYTVSYGGESYVYHLGQSGCDSVIEAVADLDGDGKPDFMIKVGGSDEYLLLSSQARPGKNKAVATLRMQGD
jgi:hypothetical protein